jgi:hypothetical protein
MMHEHVELIPGDFYTTMRDTTCDTLIVDPPYSARTQGNQKYKRRKCLELGKNAEGQWLSSGGFSYAHYEPSDVYRFVDFWDGRTRGWFCTLTDSELYPVWRDALRETGRYVFAPVPCVMRGMSVRLAGDGPSSWTVWLVVARPAVLSRWGTLQGEYSGPARDRDDRSMRGFKSSVKGVKPLWLMRSIVRDYSRPNDIVCDPCAGSGTTLLAAQLEGRYVIGGELESHAYETAKARLERAYVQADPRQEVLPL